MDATGRAAVSDRLDSIHQRLAQVEQGLNSIQGNRMAQLPELLEAWDKKCDGGKAKMLWSGAYWEFQSPQGVLASGSDEDFDADTPCALTSCTKVFTGMAVMRTMHLRPQDWYPGKFMHEFKGWEDWKNFVVLDNEDTDDGKAGWAGRRADVTVHHLLTHTCGWPFGLRAKRERIRKVPLYFMPGEKFGYSIGHRLLGWMLLDYWKANPPHPSMLSNIMHGGNYNPYHFNDLNDVFKFLVFDPLKISPKTCFIDGKFKSPHSVMGEFFDMKFFDLESDTGDDDPADLAMQATGADMMKLCMVALRRGQLPDGSWYINRSEWDKWAAVNQLPGGKLSSALADWKMEQWKLSFVWRTALTRTVNAGPFGWSYFGATYHAVDPEYTENAGPAIAVGWKGFSSCGLRADYKENISFVAMQEIVPDPGCRNFGECIHEGKVGEFSLGQVAKALPGQSEALRRMKKQDKGSCLPFHYLMKRQANPGPCTCCLQGVIRCFFKCSLPLGVKVLSFHKYETKMPKRAEP